MNSSFRNIQMVGGNATVQFGRELLHGASLADIKSQVMTRWGKSIGKAYTIGYRDSDGSYVRETYIPKLVKVKTSKVTVVPTGQMELAF